MRLDAALSVILINGDDGARFVKNRGLERMIGVASAAWDDLLIKFLRFIDIMYDIFMKMIHNAVLPNFPILGLLSRPTKVHSVRSDPVQEKIFR